MFGVVGERSKRQCYFVDDVGKLATGMKREMPRTGPWRETGCRRIVGGKRSLRRIKAINEDLVAAQIGGEGKMIGFEYEVLHKSSGMVRYR